MKKVGQLLKLSKNSLFACRNLVENLKFWLGIRKIFCRVIKREREKKTKRKKRGKRKQDQEREKNEKEEKRE